MKTTNNANDANDANNARTREPLSRPLADGVRVVALFEATKGALVLLVGLGAFSLLHQDAQAEAERLVSHFHLNPASHTPRIFIEAAAQLNDSRLMSLAWLALAYAGMRFAEAFGLWRQRRWAEWFAVLSGGIYVPIEIYEVLESVSWPRVTLLTINLIIVIYMTMTLWRTRLHRVS